MLYSAAGPGESTTDLAWDGQASIYELGGLLAETERFPSGPTAGPVRRRRRAGLRLERMRTPHLQRRRRGRRACPAQRFRRIALRSPAALRRRGPEIARSLERFPFVPDDPARLDEDCYEAYNIQVQGLAKRHAVRRGSKHLVIGVSGGLDSTHALIVAARAFDAARPAARANILGFTLPGFATSDGTKSNAWALMRALGVTGRRDRHHADRPADAGGHRPPVRARRAGLRHHLRERAGGPAHRLPVPPGQPARNGFVAGHRRPVRSWRWAGAPMASATR